MGLIYLDACILVYLVEKHPVFEPVVSQAIGSLTGHFLAVSPLAKLECLVGAIRRDDLVLQRQYETFFERCRPLDMSDDVFREAAFIRARSGLRTPDALHLACAQHHRCSALWTHDDRLARAGRGLALNVLA